jgi:hypothetical protein
MIYAAVLNPNTKWRKRAFVVRLASSGKEKKKQQFLASEWG